MVIIKVASVLNVLLATVQTANIAIIPLTPQETEFHDTMKNIIVSAQQISLVH